MFFTFKKIFLGGLLRKFLGLQVMPWNSLKWHNFSEANVISFKVGPFWHRELHFPHISFSLLKAFFCLWFKAVSQFLCRKSLLELLLHHSLFLSLVFVFLYYSTVPHLKLFLRVNAFTAYDFSGIFLSFGLTLGSLSWIIRREKITWSPWKRSGLDVGGLGLCRLTSLSLGATLRTPTVNRGVMFQILHAHRSQRFRQYGCYPRNHSHGKERQFKNKCPLGTTEETIACR